MNSFEILKKGFKKWYGCFVSIQRSVLCSDYTGFFDGFWDDVIELRLDGLVIDCNPPKLVGLAGLEGITYSKSDVVCKLESTTFSEEFKYFTLSTAQFDDFFLLYGYKTKKEALENLKNLKSSGDFYISVYFKA